jgi:hypothetical protein
LAHRVAGQRYVSRRFRLDYIAFADKATLDGLSRNNKFEDSEIDLLIVYDENNFRAPWPRSDGKYKGGLLHGPTSWKWGRLSDTQANYRGTRLDNDNPEEPDAVIAETKRAERIFAK